MSWAYNPMLAIEVSEIGATLTALSVPGIKPLFDKFILRREDTTTGSGGKYGKPTSIGRATPLRPLHLRPEHDMLGSRDTSAQGVANYRAADVSKDDLSETSADGILVQVDFQIKEDSRKSGRASSSTWR